MAIEALGPVTAAYTNSKLASRTVDTTLAGQVTFTKTTQSTDKDTGGVILEGGLGVEKNINAGGTILGSNLSGTNTGDVTIGPVGSTPNINGATLSGQVLNLEPATAIFPGVVDINAQTFSGNKTFNDDLIVNGDLTINGNLTTINTATLEVEDANIVINNGGNDATSEGAGITVERTGTNGSIAYQDTLASKFKAGPLGSESEIITASTAQTMTAIKTFAAGIINQSEFMADIAIDSTTSGSNQVITFPTKMILKVTNAGLISISGFTVPSGSNIFFLINGKGGSIDIINNDSISTDIITGTGANFELKDGAVVLFIRDTNSNRWRMVGGGGTVANAYQETPTGTVDGVNDTFTLSQTPDAQANVIVTVDGLVMTNSQWSLVGADIVFASGYIPQVGQNVYAYYSASPGGGASYTPATEYRTLTAGEIAAGKLTLLATPSSPSVVLVDHIGGTSQEFGVDYTISGNELDWGAYTLAGVLIIGSRLRIHYFT